MCIYTRIFYIYIYTYICTHLCIYIDIYMCSSMYALFLYAFACVRVYIHVKTLEHTQQPPSTCDMTHPCAWHDSSINDMHYSFLHMWHYSYVWCVSWTSVTWLMYTDLTHSYVTRPYMTHESRGSHVILVNTHDRQARVADEWVKRARGGSTKNRRWRRKAQNLNTLWHLRFIFILAGIVDGRGGVGAWKEIENQHGAARERGCFDYIVVQAYNVRLHSKRHPMKWRRRIGPING